MAAHIIMIMPIAFKTKNLRFFPCFIPSKGCNTVKFSWVWQKDSTVIWNVQTQVPDVMLQLSSAPNELESGCN